MRQGNQKAVAVIGRIRRQRQEVAQQIFAQALARVEEAQGGQKAIEADMERTAAEFRRQLQAGGVPQGSPLRQEMVELQQAAARQQVHLAELETAMESSRQDLLEAMKQQKALHWLEEKHRRQAGAARQRRSADQLQDTHASNLAARKEEHNE